MATVNTSFAGLNFHFFLADVYQLIHAHDELSGKKGRPRRDLEVFKRAAVILLVTAWETFIEDTLRDQFLSRLEKAPSPAAIQTAFNFVARAWIEKKPQSPTDVASWTGDGWRQLVEVRFNSDVEALNTPNSKNVRMLYDRYLGDDITKTWHWKNKSADSACNDLDALIVLRGCLVHRGKEMFDSESSVLMPDVKQSANLLERLVQRTEKELGIVDPFEAIAHS